MKTQAKTLMAAVCLFVLWGCNQDLDSSYRNDQSGGAPLDQTDDQPGVSASPAPGHRTMEPGQPGRAQNRMGETPAARTDIQPPGNQELPEDTDDPAYFRNQRGESEDRG